MSNSLSGNQLDSEVINYIRFPLIAWVVFLHSVLLFPPKLMELGNPVCSYFIGFLTISVRTQIFFFISGYCFFLRVKLFDFSTYLGKLKRRFHTLLVPYFLWNLIVIGYFALAYSCFPNYINDSFENVYTWSFADYASSFWNKSGGDPIAYQLWFLRDLMVISVFSPIVWFAIKKLKWISLLAIVVLYLTDFEIPCKSALVFFSIGAYFSINDKSFSDVLKNIYFKYGGVYFWIVLTSFSLMYPKEEILRKVCILFYAAAILLLICQLVLKGHKMPKLLNDSNYFVYLWHGFPILVMKFIYLKLLNPSTGIEYVAGSFIVWAVTVTIAVVLYYVLDRFLPKTTAFLIGKKR